MRSACVIPSTARLLSLPKGRAGCVVCVVQLNTYPSRPDQLAQTGFAADSRGLQANGTTGSHNHRIRRVT